MGRSRGTTRRGAVGALALAAGLVPLSACAAGPAEPPPSHVVVRVAPRAEPVGVEVRLAQARGPFRAVHTMRPGETRSFAVPAGWVTVRVPGLCVVPTRNAHPTTVEVARDGCTVA